MPTKAKEAVSGIQRRHKGRPSENETVGKDALILASVELLRTRLPGALTMAEVAKQAKVDPGLVRYYFGDLKGLLTATVSHMMTERQEIMRELLAQRGSAEERLRERVLKSLQLQQRDPNFHRLVLEQLFAADTPDAQDALEKTASRGLSLTLSLLHAGETSGEMRKVDPRFLTVALVGMFEFFVSAQPLVEALCGRLVDDELTRDYADFIVDIVLNGLSVRSPISDAPSQ
jgi:TetR/AcrR family transcriptional regulator